MRLLTLNVSNDVTLDFHNNMWGTEKVYYNGKLISCKDSIMGATHHFEIEEDGELVNYRINYGIRGFRIGIDVLRNNKMILLS